MGNALGCTEDWLCSEWGACSQEELQTRTCIDLNECGTAVYKPSEMQVCSYDNPVTEDIIQRIETLESEVSTINSILNTLQELIDAILARLTALETNQPTPTGCLYNNPSCESGYECVDNVCVELIGCAYDNPSCELGYECINNDCVAEGITPQGCAHNNPPCETGYECVDNICVLITPECTESWSCTEWLPEICPVEEIQTRTCTDLNSCGTTEIKPVETQSCTHVPPVSEDTVKFRTNVLSGAYWNSNSEIVFDFDRDGDLDCLKYFSYYRYYTNRLPEIMAYTPEGYEVHKYSDDRVIIKYRDNYIFKISDSCSVPLSNFPVEPYATNGQEVYN
jgi:hypothetical protein